MTQFVLVSLLALLFIPSSGLTQSCAAQSGSSPNPGFMVDPGSTMVAPRPIISTADQKASISEY